MGFELAAATLVVAGLGAWLIATVAEAVALVLRSAALLASGWGCTVSSSRP